MTRHISPLLIAILFSLSFCAHSHAAGPALIPIERDKALDLLPMGIGPVEKAKPSVRVGIRREEITASAMAKKEPLVMITEPRAGSVTRAYQRVSGRLGGGITKAYVRIDGETQAVTAQGGQFTFFTALLPGLNTITALGWDLDGNLGKDSITVFLDPAAEGGVAEITSPKDGTTVDTTGQRVITVLARASADAVEAVLVQGNIPRRVGIEGGRVSQDVALGPGVNELYIETVDSRGVVARSAPVRVYTFDARPKDLVAALYWDSPTADLDLHVWDSFGHHSFTDAPDSRCSGAAIPGGSIDMDKKGGYGPEVFSLQMAEPEVYAFYAKYNPGLKDTGATAHMKLLLHADEPARRIVRNFGPVHLDDKDPVWDAAHVKMPEGVFFQEKESDLSRTLGMDARAVRRLALMLKEENVRFRLLAISAMGQIKSEEALPALLEELKAGMPEIRLAAAGALWNIKSRGSVTGLTNALSDPDPEVRRAAAGALGEIGDRSCLMALTGLLHEEGDVLVKVEVIRAVGRLGDVSACGGLVPYAKDPDPGVRAETLRSLGILGDKSTGPVIAGALEDREDGVREVAAWALGRLGDAANAKPLMDALRFDLEEGVRAQAASSLGMLEDVSATDELTRSAGRDGSAMVRFCASKAMEQISAKSGENRQQEEQELPPVQLDEDVIVY